MYGELIQQTWDFPDGLVVVAPGLNIRFTPAVQIKVQGSHAMFFDWLQDYEADVPSNNVTTLMSRLVLAF
jgi:hypothetical protein